MQLAFFDYPKFGYACNTKLLRLHYNQQTCLHS